MREVARCLEAAVVCELETAPCTPERGASEQGRPPALTQHLLDAPLAELPPGAGFESLFDADFCPGAHASLSLHSPLLLGVQASMQGDLAGSAAAGAASADAPAHAAAERRASSDGASAHASAAGRAGSTAASLCCGLGAAAAATGEHRRPPRGRAEGALPRMQPEDYVSPLQSGLRFGALTPEASPDAWPCMTAHSAPQARLLLLDAWSLHANVLHSQNSLVLCAGPGLAGLLATLRSPRQPGGLSGRGACWPEPLAGQTDEPRAFTAARSSQWDTKPAGSGPIRSICRGHCSQGLAAGRSAVCAACQPQDGEHLCGAARRAAAAARRGECARGLGCQHGAAQGNGQLWAAARQPC